MPYKIKSVLREKLKETGMESLYDEMELPCLYALYEMEKMVSASMVRHCISMGKTPYTDRGAYRRDSCNGGGRI